MKIIKPGLFMAAFIVVTALALSWNINAMAQGQSSGDKAAAAGTSKPAAAAPKTDAEIIAQQKPTYPLETCVVMGKKLGDRGEPVDYVYKGRLVRFCCKGCISTFEKDPAKYLAMIDEAAKSKQKAGATDSKAAPVTSEVQPNVQPAAAVWTCSMHPEVRESKPGKCPKCGMDLVKAAAAPTSDKK